MKNKDNNGCTCKECNPKKLKDYLIYLLPLATVISGLIQLSTGVVFTGVGLCYLIYKIKQVETKIDNSKCWY